MDLFGPGDSAVLPVPGADVLLYKDADLGRPYADLLDELITTTNWRSDQVKVFGKSYQQPRLVAWHGDPGTVYSYSGITLEPQPWTATLLEIRRRVEWLAGHRFNSVLLNYYRDHRDSMGLHADDEPELGSQPVIASLSLGEERVFILKDSHHSGADSIRLPLPSGSLLIMKGATQENWKHGIHKESSPCGPRINLTFRTILL